MNKIMRRLTLALLALLPVVSSCDLHEFPVAPKYTDINLKLSFSTDFPQWEYPVPEDSKTTVPSKSVLTSGEMRYIVRLYPQGTRSTRASYFQEFEFTKDVSEGYNDTFELSVPEGDYSLMVWADLRERVEDKHFYNIDDFSQITFGTHIGNYEYRDAFRGISEISVKTSTVEHEPETFELEMVRPLAKFEFVTTDILEFIDREVKAAALAGKTEVGDDATKAIDLNTYKIVYYYVGYMPNTFNMFTDKPSDSVTGVNFNGRLLRLSEREASLGFDYVFVNGRESSVTVQVGIYSEDGTQLSMTSPIKVPLRRSEHTLMKGKFLMQNASGGVGIDPSFEGEFVIPIL